MSAPATTMPKLRDGERMDAETFWRLYEAAPPGVRAELVGGVVRMPPPLSGDDHGRPHAELTFVFMCYLMGTPGVFVYTASTVRLGPDDAPEPDLALRIGTGGLSRMVDGFITGPPELSAEIAASTDSFDRNAKLRSYEEAGIPEYLIWRTLRRLFEWRVLEEGGYVLLAPDPDGIIRSRILPGCWIDPEALLRGDLTRCREVMELGLASPAHAAFVALLAARSAGA
ncbi:MAG: Uma2 family endonuclease [Gemmataceae bacterium]|nr:Uma2 family endonuclease [Gemmataceae bacterium]